MESFHSKFWFHLNTHSSSPAGLLLLGSPQPQLVYSGTSPLSDQTKLPLTQLLYIIWQNKTIYLLLKCHSIQSSRCSSDQETCQCTSLPPQWKIRPAGRHWSDKTTIMHDIFVFLFYRKSVLQTSCASNQVILSGDTRYHSAPARTQASCPNTEGEASTESTILSTSMLGASYYFAVYNINITSFSMLLISWM